jgi:hypothetical protein
MNTDTIRSILNIVFMVLAIASVITYFVVEDFTTFIYVCAAAIFCKLCELHVTFVLYDLFFFSNHAV